MYLIDTNVISEIRKGINANQSVQRFFQEKRDDKLLLSVVTIGEIHRGIERLIYRKDIEQATQLDKWLQTLLHQYSDSIVPIDLEIAELWGKLCGFSPHQAIDKFLAATALLYDVTLVTRNTADFLGTGVALLNPFEDKH
jgi:predicted nucleic acid-binding protein